MTLLADQGKAVASARSFSGLSSLISPIDVALFQRDYWESKPLLVQRDDPAYYRDLLTLDDVDRLLSTSGHQLSNVRVVVNGRERAVSELRAAAGVNSLESLYEHYRNGWTIVLNRLDDSSASLQRLSRELAAEVNARFQMNIYVTPAGNQGFKAHYDTHDVFVAQVHGSKRWRVASQPYRLPLADQQYDKSQPEPEPDLEFDLRAGDMLYLPRGTVHWAASNDAVSVHATIGMHPLLWSDVILGAAKDLFAEDVRFRTGLPIGFVNDEGLRPGVAVAAAELLEALRSRITPDALADAAVERGASVSWPALRHHLVDLEELDRLGLGTRVRRRPDQRWHLTTGGDVVRLSFHNKTVEFPASVTDEVSYVARSNGSGFTGQDIPGDLDGPGRLILLTTLVREGFLTLT